MRFETGRIIGEPQGTPEVSSRCSFRCWCKTPIARSFNPKLDLYLFIEFGRQARAPMCQGFGGGTRHSEMHIR
jgi:hypothetical protein